MLPGERDLALGVPLLRKLARQARIPLVASNLYGKDGKRLFEADSIVDAAGVKIGVFGVAAPPAPDDAAAFQAAGVEARDPEAAARAEVAGLRGRGAQLIVAMVHLGDAAANRKLLRAVPGIDWAVLGHSGMNLEMPETAGGARMLEAMMKGKHVGRLDLHVVGDRLGDKLAFTDRGERAMLETILADHRRQLTEYDGRLGDTNPAQMRDYYAQRKQEIRAAIERETALLQATPAVITGSWFENRIILLDQTTPDQPGVAILVDAYNKENAKRAAAGKPVGLGTETKRPDPAAGNPAAATAAAVGPTYLGTTACGACHQPALAQWKTTKHARALSALTRIGRDKDRRASAATSPATCSPGARRSSPRRAKSSRTSDASHATAPARPTSRLQTRRSRPRAVPEAICRGCHTADVTNGEFDYDRFGGDCRTGARRSARRRVTQEPARSAVNSPGLWIVAPATAPCHR